jgi:sporulation protein YlmC with PRC-barrel domain
MRLSDLRNKTVKTLDGDSVGRVHDVHSDDGRVIALMCGAPSFIERLTAKSHGRRIPWECVRKVEKDHILVTPNPPRRTSKPGASRSRKGTPRASARPSKR